MTSKHRGALAFLAVTFAASWCSAWLLRDFWGQEHPDVTLRLVRCSIAYVLTTGWQPLAAVFLVRRFLEAPVAMDAGLRSASVRHVMAGVLVSLGSIAVSWLLASALHGAAAADTPRDVPSASALSALLAIVTAGVVYGQCLVEEIGWRGYFLVRAMELGGPWRGLVLHGLVWGVWYAPILLFVDQHGAHSTARALGFTVTCSLLGVFLGYLRLASRSIVPAAIANFALTLGAGLPIVLSGVDTGPRNAVYLPVGWVALSLIAVSIAATGARTAVVTPRPPLRRGALDPRLH